MATKTRRRRKKVVDWAAEYLKRKAWYHSPEQRMRNRQRKAHAAGWNVWVR